VCGWTLAGLLGLVNKSGKDMTCSGKDCNLRHPKTLSEVTRTGATEAIGEWLVNDKLKAKACMAMLDVTTWKTA
jgi:hypothetical protein